MLDAMERDLTERFAGKEVHLGAAYTCSDEEAQTWKQEIQERFPGHSIHMDRLSLSAASCFFRSIFLLPSGYPPMGPTNFPAESS